MLKTFQIVRNAVEQRQENVSQRGDTILDTFLEKGVPENQIDAELVIAL